MVPGVQNARSRGSAVRVNTATPESLLTSGQLNREGLPVGAEPLLPELRDGREQDCQDLLLRGCREEAALISVEGSAVPNRPSQPSFREPPCRFQAASSGEVVDVLGRIFLLGKHG